MLFAASALLLLLEHWSHGGRPRLRDIHVAILVYLAAAAAALAFAEEPHALGGAKLLGMAELGALFVVTSELASRPGISRSFHRVVAATALLVSATALVGVGLFLAGIESPLVGGYGDLERGAYARARAGFPHPNLLASFCVFASAVVARREAELSEQLRSLVQIALATTVVLTFSRGILAFTLAAVLRWASTRPRLRIAAALAVAFVVLLAALTLWHLSVDPTRPFSLRLEVTPSSRLQAATSAWRTFVARPLWGSGTGTSPGVKDGAPFDAHLTLLNIAAGIGLPALLAFLAIPAALWRARRRPADPAIWGGLAGLALDSLAQDIEDFRHLWVLFGLADAHRDPAR